ncbi:MAG: glycosyltransferase 87 family protein [Oscillospiraceae bacterium]
MEATKKSGLHSKSLFSSSTPLKWEYVLAACVGMVAFLLFAHPDIIETANHSWLLLQNTFKGNFFGFYDDVYAHQNSFYYINAAHYNIFVYLIFALWELPVYIICSIFTISINETFLCFWAKLLACAFMLACGYISYLLAKRMGVSEGSARFAGLAVLLSPITLFSVFSMGQYDSICLFFMLLALLFYFDKKYLEFCFVIGFAIVCKFFAIFLLLPLLLLCEKRITRLIFYIATSFWLYIPTTLLFMGRTGDAGFFNKLMTERLLSAQITFGNAKVPVFLLAFAILMAFCFFYRQDGEKESMRFSIYICLVAFSLLFLFTGWHPQWLVLLVTFMVLTTVTAENKAPYFVLDIVLCIGYFALTYFNFPSQLEGNMFNFGLLGIISGLQTANVGYNNLAFYFGLIPYFLSIASALFAGGIVAGIIFKMPLRGTCLSDKLSKGAVHAPSLHAFAFLPMLCAYGGFFFLPCIFEWLKCFKFI